MKKIWILFILVIVIAVWAYVYREQASNGSSPILQSTAINHPSVPTPTPTPIPTVTKPTPPPTIQTAAGTASFSSGADGEDAGSNIQVYEVDFTDSGFSPTTSNLNVGDYIFFRNKSTANFLPFDAAYSGLDAKTAVAPGQEFKFQFNQAGSWTVENELNPAETTVVVVSK